LEAITGKQLPPGHFSAASTLRPAQDSTPAEKPMTRAPIPDMLPLGFQLSASRFQLSNVNIHVDIFVGSRTQ
jgi:hypothetical protein